jgi:protein phosphatase
MPRVGELFSYLPDSPRPAGPLALFALADGIGGHAAGDVASRLACERLSSFFLRISKTSIPGLSAGALRRAMVRSFFAIDERIGRLAGGEGKYAHMGTTLTALALTAEHGVVAHAGDSRLYRLRGKKLEKRTTDHTFVQDLISYGELTENEAAVHPFRHMLTGAVGTREPLESVFADTFRLRGGDRFLLCTDGLHDMLDHGAMERIMGGDGGPQQIASALVDAANDRGGKDNVTAVVVLI